MGRRLRVVFHADGIISQFEGYEALEEFDWEGYRQRYDNIGRLDLILQAEIDTTYRTTGGNRVSPHGLPWARAGLASMNLRR